ncbi:3,4-dihydroxy-2-butanone-4-phosphate synthase [Vibrio viridaestus]|uniref:3,4-dihydroxy-2-butanone 4-phosphate synthase n=1 Tax=Vibrio viridaestus TaxID=2487322 RepID=A0A3N9TLP1_9VIBR|nr:3,4-dihydroxy-2-butanone-4-phosphate synthase [Vibrio viridaestus]RQW65051.1 3,4-dihydroxy-2-butanone-4-phosphate synthase [Vibrio viridaestus]
MNQTSPLAEFGDVNQRVENAILALQQGRGVLVLDDENRENEGDLIYSAETITPAQMAFMIRECSGIVCLCLTDEHADHMELSPMVEHNDSQNQTAFTVSIEAKVGVTTGVSAADRVTTIKAAIAEGAQPSDLARPGHVFPLRARAGGVLVRRGHTEGTVELMKLAGLALAGILSEVTNVDGTMARMPEIIEMGRKYDLPVLTIEDIVEYISLEQKQIA